MFSAVLCRVQHELLHALLHHRQEPAKLLQKEEEAIQERAEEHVRVVSV